MSSQIPNADALVDFVLQFTGSSNTTEIVQCIFLFEHSLRNVELPCQRSDPYAETSYGIADNNGRVPIPVDMMKPILFFKQGNQQLGQTGAGQTSDTGPWIVYDRIGDRDIITNSLIAQLYWKPVNVARVIRGKFSEVANMYEFLPLPGNGDVINMYYYKAWPFLYSVDETGQVVQQNGPFLSFQEGYIYGTLREYYNKRKMPEDAAVWNAKYQEAYNNLMDQYEKGKWNGGHTRLTSVWQPRVSKQYQIR